MSSSETNDGGTGQAATARRFVALPIPAEIRDRLAAALPRDEDAPEGLRWARPEGWHVTLAFLGDVEDARVREVVDAIGRGVDAIDGPPERLELGEPGRFGRKVLWVAVIDEPQDSLRRVADEVRSALADIGLPSDAKPLHAHLTLARAGRSPVGDRTVAACAPPTGTEWRPDAIELWRSQLGQGPARYETEARIPVRP